MTPPSRTLPRLLPLSRLLSLPLALALGCAAKPTESYVPDSGPPLQPGSVLEIARDDTPEGVDGAARAWQRSALEGNTTRLTVGDDRSLDLHDVEVRVLVEGLRARVLLDLLFDNPDDQVYEGRFQIRLPGDATPYFLAFGQSAFELGQGGSLPSFADGFGGFAGLGPSQIMAGRAGHWIAPKEARMVPRELAQRAYENTVNPRLPLSTIGPQLPPRVAVDPALAEWAGAGVFDAKVFPIGAKRAHRLVIGYDMDLDRVGDDLELRLPLPLHREGSSLSVDVEVRTAGDASPQLTPAPTILPPGEDGALRYRLDDPRGPLHLRLPGPAPLLVGGDSSGSFFASRLTPKLPASVNPQTRRAVFVIDTSKSARPEQLGAWLDLTSAVLKNNRRELREFAVVLFDINTRWWREEFVANTPANVDALVAHVRSLTPEGASNIGAALDAATRPRWSDLPPEWNIFLLSDGAATWGETSPTALAQRLGTRAKAPLYAYQTPGADRNPWLLQQLAESTGGAVFSMSRASELDEVARAHRRRPWELVDVTLEGTTDLLLDGAPRVLYPGQEVQLVGRGEPAAGAAVVMTVRQSQGQGRTRDQVVRTPLGAALTSQLAPRIYGEVAVAQIEASISGAPPAEAEAYARHFRIPGQTCSLLMLETEQDYAKYGIVAQADAELVRDAPAVELLARARAALPKDAGAAFVRWIQGMVLGGDLALDNRLQVLLPALPGALFVGGEVSDPSPSSSPSPSPSAGALAGSGDDPIGRLRTLSSRLEEAPGDARIVAQLAFSALAWGEPSLVADVLEASRHRVARRANLSLVYALGLVAQGRSAAAIIYFELAIQRHDQQLHGLNVGRAVFAYEYSRLLSALSETEGPLQVFAQQRYAELRSSHFSGATVGVSLLWDSPHTDVDLIVTDPEGRTCDYRECLIPGASMGVDTTEGYGPEVFVLGDVSTMGTYTISARYFSGARHRDSESAQVMATVYRDINGADDSLTRYAATLTRVGERQVLASVTLGPDEPADKLADEPADELADEPADKPADKPAQLAVDPQQTAEVR